MIFWSFGPSPGLCHADRESRQKDGMSPIAPNTTGWGRKEEGGERKHHRKWERMRGKKWEVASWRSGVSGQEIPVPVVLGLPRCWGTLLSRVCNQGNTSVSPQEMVVIGSNSQKIPPKDFYQVVTSSLSPGSCFLPPMLSASCYINPNIQPSSFFSSHSRLLWEWQPSQEVRKEITSAKHNCWEEHPTLLF